MQTFRRFVPALLILAALAAAIAAGVPQKVTWQAIAGRQAAMEAFVAARPLESAAIYAGVYALVVALSLPLALPMTLTGGLLFGTLPGAALALLGATSGASAVFHAVRTALLPFLTARVGQTMARLAERLRRDGLSYMLALRLLPVVPFWLVNIAAGASGMRWRIFAAGTMLGSAPAAVVIASMGSGIGSVLARGETPDISTFFSLPVLGPLCGLAALSLLPVAWRHLRGADA